MDLSKVTRGKVALYSHEDKPLYIIATATEALIEAGNDEQEVRFFFETAVAKESLDDLLEHVELFCDIEEVDDNARYAKWTT